MHIYIYTIYFRSQIRQTLKKKAFEDAGIPAKQVPVVQQANFISRKQSLPILTKQKLPPQSPPVIAQQVVKSVQMQQPRIISALPLANMVHLEPSLKHPVQQLQQKTSMSHLQEIQLPSNSMPTSSLHMQPTITNNNNTSNHTQIIQTTPKQIIIRQQTIPHPATIQMQQGGSPRDANSQQAQTQVVHLPHKSQIHLPNTQNLQSSVANSKVTATTVTLQQFQQMHVQKTLLTNVIDTYNANSVTQQQLYPSSIDNQFYSKNKANATVSSVSALLPVINSSTNNAVVKSVTTLNNSLTNVSVVDSAGPIPSATNLSSDQTKPTASTLSSIATVTTTSGTLKSGPDVTMTLNRINTEGNEIDAEECLPADVKMDYASEGVAG